MARSRGMARRAETYLYRDCSLVRYIYQSPSSFIRWSKADLHAYLTDHRRVLLTSPLALSETRIEHA